MQRQPENGISRLRRLVCPDAYAPGEKVNFRELFESAERERAEAEAAGQLAERRYQKELEEADRVVQDRYNASETIVKMLRALRDEDGVDYYDVLADVIAELLYDARVVGDPDLYPPPDGP